MADSSTASLLTDPMGNGVIYFVQPGDTLTRIVEGHAKMCLVDPAAAVRQVMKDNPHLKNANRIFPGNPIFLRSASAAKKETLPAATHSEVRQCFATLRANSGPEMSALVRHSDLFGIALSSSENLSKGLGDLVQNNRSALTTLIQEHHDYRANGVSRAGYQNFSNSRSQVMSKMQSDFGRSTKAMLGGSAKDVTTLHRGRSANPTARLSTSANRLSRIATGAKAGGFVLQVASVGVTAEVTRQKICAAPTQLQKNQELVGGAGGFGGGLVGGAAGGAVGGIVAGLVLGSNPAGWAVLLIIAAGSVAGGYAGGKAGESGSKYVYTEHGTKYDLVDAVNIESLCGN